MKKYGILACAALVSLLGGRLNAAVESDIVGYTTITMEAGHWYQVGNPFLPLDESVTEMKINEIFVGGFSGGDTLQVVDPIEITAKTYYWNVVKKGWAETTSPGSSLTEESISIGEAVYIYKKNTEGSVTFSGVVDIVDLDIGNPNSGSWTLATYLYPIPININEIEWDGASGGDTLTIIVEDDAGKSKAKTYYWNVVKKGWAETTSPGSDLVDQTIAIGQAMYIYKKNPGTITMKNPSLN